MSVSTDQLATKRATARVFAGAGSPRVIGVGLAVAAVSRVVIGGWSWTDLVVVALTVAAVGVVEWGLHLFVLHGPEHGWMSRRLGAGSGHRQHHRDPSALEWVLLRAVDALVFLVLIAVATVAWTLPLALTLDAAFGWSPMLGPALTGVTAAFAALAHYEWTHLLVHTRYRPRTRHYRRLDRNHRLHHFRNERYWLGVTSNWGDRIMRTCPADKADVELSDTARQLA